jgi:multidrug transporter EmrE-like cation transporter
MTAHTPLASILCFLAAAFSGALGQYLYKSGADAAGSGWRGYVLNWQLALGVLCYILVMVLFVAAFRIGGRMTVLYPVYATTFIWSALIAWRAFGTPVTLVNVAGMALMTGGIYLLGRQG